MTVTISKVGTRMQCGKVLRSTSKDKDFGLITDVKLTRVSFFVWHLSFDAEMKI